MSSVQSVSGLSIAAIQKLRYNFRRFHQSIEFNFFRFPSIARCSLVSSSSDNKGVEKKYKKESFQFDSIFKQKNKNTKTSFVLLFHYTIYYYCLKIVWCICVWVCLFAYIQLWPHIRKIKNPTTTYENKVQVIQQQKQQPQHQ